MNKFLGNTLNTAVQLLLVVTLSLTAFVMGKAVMNDKNVEAYEVVKDVKDLPPYSMTENNSVSDLQTNPSVVRLHTTKASTAQKLVAAVTLSQAPKEEEFFCTAFVISDYYAVTAGHCLDDKNGMKTDEIEIFVQYMDEETRLPAYKSAQVKARAVGINRRGDTGLLMGNFSSFRKVKFSPYPADILEILNVAAMNGGQLVAVGFPYGDVPMTVSVKYTGTYVFQLEGQTLLYPGMSGGPLIEPITGYAVGINSSAGYNRSQFSSLIGLLESLNIKVAQ